MRAGNTSARATRTLIACLTWLSNVVQFVKCVGGSPPFAAGELDPRLRNCRRHPLILDGAPTSHPRRIVETGSTRRRRAPPEQSACTFYLVFKEPDVLLRSRTLRRVYGRAPLQLYFRQGNLSILRTVAVPVNPSSPAGRSFLPCQPPASADASSFPMQPRAGVRRGSLRAEGSAGAQYPPASHARFDQYTAPGPGLSTSARSAPPAPPRPVRNYKDHGRADQPQP
jgi:hypothetical protein